MEPAAGQGRFAITQVTSLMAHEPTWGGVVRGMLVLAALWWAWSVLAYVLAQVALLFRTTGRVFRRRTIGTIVLFALIPVALVVPALAAQVLVSAACALVVAYEVLRHRESRIRLRHPEHAR
jgi:low temperature requirement protein LtrA